MLRLAEKGDFLFESVIKINSFMKGKQNKVESCCTYIYLFIDFATYMQTQFTIILN